MKVPARAIIAALALTATGCGFNASPASGLQFQAPGGWRASPGILGMMQFWRPPADDQEVLILFKSPRPVQTSDFFSNSHMNQSVQHLNVERRQDIVICGNQRATYVQGRGVSSRGDQVAVDMIATDAAGTTYFATYVRPVATAPNAMAEAALRELCPKP
jgi:hypothetical protein